MSFFFVALALTAVMMFAMGFFLLGTPPLLLLKYDVPNDARFVRGLSDLYFVAVMVTAALAGVCYALGGQFIFSAGMGCAAAFALAVRRLVVRRMDALRERMRPGDRQEIAQFRRLFLGSMMANGVQFGAVAVGLTQVSSPEAAMADANSQPVPQRFLTGRDATGKSVFKAAGITPQVIRIDSNPGLTFYELYATDGVPPLSGREADPMLRKTQDFPGPGGTNFRLISYPPRRPAGWKPPAGVTFASALAELDMKVPGMGRHFDREAPGMHTTDTVDYGIVVRGEMTLELDDGQTMHLRQGDCVIQNGTRHRWRNPSTVEPCLMAFVSVGGRRAG
jgi:mannose-6-phosphate isomerase-like protein (cupin superfamily)